jgi:hypothetical protein
MMRPLTRHHLPLLALLAMFPEVAHGDVGEFLIIDRALQTTTARVVEINDRELIVLSEGGAHETVPRDRCIAVLRTDSDPVEAPAGVLLLNDGQRLPGQLSANTPQPDALTWIHPWLAPITVPLDRVRAVRAKRDHAIPQPGAADVVELVNGDRLEGFVTAIGKTISIEVELDDQPQTLRVPFDRLAALALVSPERASRGARVWFAGETVLDVDEIAVGDDGYVRYTAALTGGSPDPIQARLSEIRAILFEPSAMRPLARLQPSHVSAPVPRFVVPEPRILGGERPLGLQSIEFRGPLLVRYVLPQGATRFAARALLPEAAHEWGDFELIVRDNDEVVFRTRLNAEHPSAPIHLELRGSELTFELAEGAHGPIQDWLVLEHAMLLVE